MSSYRQKHRDYTEFSLLTQQAVTFGILNEGNVNSNLMNHLLFSNVTYANCQKNIY